MQLHLRMYKEPFDIKLNVKNVCFYVCYSVATSNLWVTLEFWTCKLTEFGWDESCLWQRAGCVKWVSLLCRHQCWLVPDPWPEASSPGHPLQFLGKTMLVIMFCELPCPDIAHAQFQMTVLHKTLCSTLYGEQSIKLNRLALRLQSPLHVVHSQTPNWWSILPHDVTLCYGR